MIWLGVIQVVPIFRTMKMPTRSYIVLLILTFPLVVISQELTSDISYIPDGHSLQKLDIYVPESNESNEKVTRPVIFWIHGGGWVTGDKSDVSHKPEALTGKGFVFVSINYRLLPEVAMEDLVLDVARAFAWTIHNIQTFGGDPNQIIVGGHSAGAQLAALICTDDRYLKREGIAFDVLKGCFISDGDTYDIPKIIMTAELRQALYGKNQPTFGHRQKFGNHPQKHVDFSPVTHITENKGIPPFLILYFSGNPETAAQAGHLASRLKQAGIRATTFGNGDTNHRQLNRDLGLPNDPATRKLFQFLDSL